MRKIVFIFIVTALFSCEEKLDLNRQKVFFEVHYINFAWVYTNNGILIDSAGNVNSFDLKKMQSWKYPDENGYISADAMNENYSLCSKTNDKINIDSLEHFINKIPFAAKGTVSKPENIMADAGTTQYIAYIYDTEAKSYKKVLLFQWGDTQITNNSKHALDIYHWLLKIRQKNQN